MCTKRKVKITIKDDVMSFIMQNLGLDYEEKDSFITRIVEIEETKKNYEFLATSDLIEDWEFIDDEEEEVVLFTHSSEDKLKSVQEEKDDIKQLYLELLDIPSQLALSVTALMFCRKNRPSLGFRSRVFKREILEKIDLRDANAIVPIRIKEFMKGYYFDVPQKEMIEDFIDRCHAVWYKKGCFDSINDCFYALYDVNMNFC